ncbi:hypothetical protein [Kitasatospora sp. NPDC091207]|uniref:hypothetical protein n=1 Tax=Kitasatospora sp. NPDC091207 TaxID=3364083 RepID=UPI003812CCE1
MKKWVRPIAGAAVLAGVLPGVAQAAPVAQGQGVVQQILGEKTCPSDSGLWQNGDTGCRVAYNGSNWYSKDWVAVHLNNNGHSAWVNGYSASAGTFYVRIVQNRGPAIDSARVEGGQGNGASAGVVSRDPGQATGTIYLPGGGIIQVKL